MKFENKPETKNKSFGELNGGDVFEYCGAYYIKLFERLYSGDEPRFNSIALSKGIPATMLENDKIVQVTGKFIRVGNDYLTIIL